MPCLRLRASIALNAIPAAMAVLRPVVDGGAGADKCGASTLSATADRRRLSAATSRASAGFSATALATTAVAAAH